MTTTRPFFGPPSRVRPAAHRASMRAPVLAAAALLAAAACGSEPPAPEPLPPWHEGDGHRWRELRVAGEGDGFTPLGPGRTGLEIPYEVDEETLYGNELLAEGSGAAAADVDGDGRTDLYVTRLQGSNGLFLNRGGLRFREAPGGSGAALEDHRSTAAVLEDVDGDGDPDLLVGGLGDGTRLLLNDGGGRFTDATDGAGFRGDEGTKALALADVDGDGLLDLYVGNYKARKAVDIFTPAERRDERVFVRQGDTLAIAPRYREHYTILRSDGRVQRWELPERDRFYLNRGDGRFEEVPFTGGRFLGADGEPLDETPRDWALTVRFQDLDGDGDQDLYACNDFRSPDRVWLNRGDGTFRLLDPLRLRTTSYSCMAVDFTDLDGDGGTEILASDMRFREGPEARRHVRGTYPDRPPPDSVSAVVQVNFNTLGWHRADGTWSEIGRHAGVAATGWTWGAAFVDVDLDGREDVLLTTGSAFDFLDAEVQGRMRSGERPITARERLAGLEPLRQPNASFRALADDLRFRETSRRWSFGAEEDISHALVPADLDGDGDLDVLVTRWGRSPVLYRNDSPASRVAVRLRGRAPNTSAVGAAVRLRGGARPVQTRQVTAGGLYLADEGSALSFAAGRADSMSLEVRWPAGVCTRLPVRPGRLYEVSEPPSSPADTAGCGGPGGDDGPDDAESGAAGGPGDGARAAPARPVFRDRTAGLGHRHVDRPSEEFRRQPLVPYRIGQLGPGVSWQDVDRDGDPDLLVPSGRGGSLALFRNDGGRLRREEGEGAAWGARAVHDQTTVLALPSPGGGTELLLGTSAYEVEEASGAAEVPAVRRYDVGAGESAVDTAVPGARSVPGPLALADVDGDDDLDLFVGHRVYPAAYPIPPSSQLYRNDGGRLVRDRAASAAFERVGLVTSALFADLERDGDPDLLLATEWGPIRVFRNEAGSFREVTAGWGLADLPGWWTGLAAGDLNGDGRQDLVATSWGTNTEYGRVTPETPPLQAYFGLFDDNSSLDFLLARRDSAVGGPAPLRGWQWLKPALPGVARSVEGYGDFSRRTVEDLLGLPRQNVSRAEARELRHLVLLNRGGSFEPRPLPMEAQIAPAFGAAVAEIDGDGREDVVLTQNLSGVPPGDGPYRAGRSLWLRGDGGGGFLPLPDSVSSLGVYGDGRGMAVADYDGDGRTDVAVGQHASPTRLFRNVGSEPGLRVRLRGPPANPHAVGATVRVVYRDGSVGPAREIRAGGGHRSADGPVPVLGLAGEPEAVRIRWPGGAESEVPVPAGEREVSAAMTAGETGGER